MTNTSAEHRSPGQPGLTKAPLTLHTNEAMRAQLYTAAKLVGTTPSMIATLLLAQALDQVPSNSDRQRIVKTTQLNTADLLAAVDHTDNAAELLMLLGEQDNAPELLATLDEEIRK